MAEVVPEPVRVHPHPGLIAAPLDHLIDPVTGQRPAVASPRATAGSGGEDSRVYTSYPALSLTDPAFDIRPLTGNSDAVIGAVAAQLRAAGRLVAGVDTDLEATSPLALSAGLGTSVLAGQRSVGEALAVIRYHLDRLLPADGCETDARRLVKRCGWRGS
jgi:BetI-type transcriptional repressor, C-terminal